MTEMPASDDGNVRGVLPNGYLEAGERWEEENHRKLRKSRNLAWFITGFFGLICLISVVAVAALVPLRTFEPYVVTVDKTTGFLEVARALKPGDMRESEAVTTANIVRYVRARETYDPRAIADNFDLAQLYSTGQASKDLRYQFEQSNPKALYKVLGNKTRINVTVKSVSFLNQNTATVRFQTETMTENTVRIDHWVAVIRYRYSSSPLKNEYRFDNPLGFQVTSYRRDQESLPDAADARIVR